MATTSRSSPKNRSVSVLAILMFTAVVPLAVTAWLQSQSTSGGASMWATSVVEGTELESYSTLAEMTREADAVVRGQVVSVVPGRVLGVPDVDVLHYAEATVRITEVLAGAVPNGSSEILLEIPLFSGPEFLATMQEGVPWSESVYFLRNKGEQAKLAGESAEVLATESKYYRLVVMAGFVVNEGGRAVVVHDAQALASMEGIGFGEAVAKIKASR